MIMIRVMIYCIVLLRTRAILMATEDPDGIVIMRDIDSNNVTGITVFHIIKMLTDEDSRLLFLEKYIDYNVLKQIFEHIMVK